MALNVGFSLGLRMEIYEYAAGTYNLVDYSITSPLSSGAQWVSFDFSGTSQLTEGTTYLVWLSLLQSTTKFGNQAHYWLVSGPATSAPVAPSIVMAENTLIDIGTGVPPSSIYALGTPSLCM